MSAPPDAANRTWTILELLRWTTQHFEGKGVDTARLDAEILLAHALKIDRLQMYVDFEKLVLDAERARFRELVRRRASERVPVSLLVGRKEFWSLSLRVTDAVLTPRPDTETLVAAALERLPEADGAYRILDIGTGSGAIALALAVERPNAHLTATDVSSEALQIARENAEELHVNDRIRFLQGAVLEPVGGETFDAVVSNPPYLAAAEAASLAPELAHEPAAALFGGEDGLAVLGPLIAGVNAVLEPGGFVVVEIDPRQTGWVSEACTRAELVEVEMLRDLAGRVRAIAARRPATG